MSYRLVYSPAFLRRMRAIPAGLNDCVEYHLGEMERADSAPGVSITFPHPPGMGYYYLCLDADGTPFQLIARYRFGQDEQSLELLGLACYPLANLPES